jgi:hypothetical protein
MLKQRAAAGAAAPESAAAEHSSASSTTPTFLRAALRGSVPAASRAGEVLCLRLPVEHALDASVPAPSGPAAGPRRCERGLPKRAPARQHLSWRRCEPAAANAALCCALLDATCSGNLEHPARQQLPLWHAEASVLRCLRLAWHAVKGGHGVCLGVRDALGRLLIRAGRVPRRAAVPCTTARPRRACRELLAWCTAVRRASWLRRRACFPRPSRSRSSIAALQTQRRALGQRRQPAAPSTRGDAERCKEDTAATSGTEHRHLGGPRACAHLASLPARPDSARGTSYAPPAQPAAAAAAQMQQQRRPRCAAWC